MHFNLHFLFLLLIQRKILASRRCTARLVLFHKIHYGLVAVNRVSVNTTLAPSATCLCRLPQPPARN